MAKSNAQLQKEVDDLKAGLADALKSNEIKQKLIDNSIEFVENGIEVGEPITRTDIIKAMLPQIRLQHARPDTQQLMRSVDEVLETINA